MDKLGFSELNTEKVNFFTQSPTKIFCISVFNVGGCFRPIATWLLIKKTGTSSVEVFSSVMLTRYLNAGYFCGEKLMHQSFI